MVSGKVKGEDAVANGLANWAASQAHLACGQAELEAYLAYLDSKRADFIALLVDINMLIIDILDADAQRRKDKTSQSKCLPGISAPKPLPIVLATSFDCPPTSEGAMLELWEPCGAQTMIGTNPEFDMLYLFWNRLTFCMLKKIILAPLGLSSTRALQR